MFDNFINVVWPLNGNYSLHVAVYEENLKDNILVDSLNEIESVMQGVKPSSTTKLRILVYDHRPNIFIRNDMDGSIIPYPITYGKQFYKYYNGCEAFNKIKTFRQFLDEHSINIPATSYRNLFFDLGSQDPQGSQMRFDQESQTRFDIEQKLKSFVTSNVPRGYKIDYVLSKI
jgi:hypothetical protein